MAATSRIHSAGRTWFAQLLNKAISQPTTLYLGLRQLDGSGGHPADSADADTLTSNLQEVSTSSTGYARQAITVDSTNLAASVSGGNALITIAQQTFGAFTATVTGITHWFLASTSDNTGVLIGSGALSTTRNVASGDTLKVTAKLTIGAGA